MKVGLLGESSRLNKSVLPEKVGISFVTKG